MPCHHRVNTVVGTPGRQGDGGELAAATNSTLVIATTNAASWLLRSVDAGRHWTTTARYNDGGAGLSDLGFTTPSQGVVIHGLARPGSPSADVVDELLMTHDASASWRHITF